MIIGIGVDLVDGRRIENIISRFGSRFTERIFTKSENDYCCSSPHPTRAYANRFAAKEAAVKALGTGIREGINWQDIEIKRDKSGAPQLILHEQAYERALSLIPKGYKLALHVSFSDDPPYSVAFVVISAVTE